MPFRSRPPFPRKPSQSPPITVSPARRVAFEALLRVEQDRSWGADALDAELKKLGDAGNPDRLDADRRLAREITLGVLRRRGWLDAALTRLANRPISQIDPATRTALRIGLYQIVFLDRIPESAAVNESVNLVKQSSATIAGAGFVNAVLREALRSGPKRPSDDPADIAVPRRWEDAEATLSHPAWLLAHWARQWTPARAIQIAVADNRPAPIFLWFNPLRGNPTETRAELEAAGATLRDIPGLPDCVEWLDGPLPKLWPLADAGKVYLQDAGSRRVAAWLDVKPGMTVLDTCAAPGGKTASLAARMENRGRIVALDVHRSRVSECRENCTRLGATIVETHVRDAALDFSQNLPFTVPEGGFDAVLVDAPCSGTGTLRRHPEIKWRIEARKLAEFADLQTRILWNAATLVKPGGTLLYATCSIEEKENEEVVRTFRNRHPEFEVFPPADAGEALTRENFLRLWPDGGTDGFFAARFRRKTG